MFYLRQELIVGPRIKRNDALREQRMRLDERAHPFIASLTDILTIEPHLFFSVMERFYNTFKKIQFIKLPR